MYLKRLELHGFKSFADKTVLEFMPGITVVIGPNGSGKSNISDSIRWVLGEQSMKSLRGSKSEDIIFAGTETRKSLGFAEVSIVIDNSDGKLPIDYTEVTVTRRIYRSGESGYFINKSPCRLKDILELFMDTGIGKDGYSIIGQGKIDEILSNKSEDRRHIFEEAAGIVKYRVRKEESEKKLEQTKLNLVRINDILTEIEGNIEPLRKQSEKAKTYLDLREKLKSIEIGLFLYNINEDKRKITEIIENLNILEEQNKNEKERLEVFQGNKENLKNNIEKINLQIEDKQKISFETTTNIEKLNADINLSMQKIENNKENHERYLNEINDLENRLSELKKEKEERVIKQEKLSEEKSKYEYELQMKQKELEEINSKLSEEELEIERKKEELSNAIDLKYEKNSQINEKKINLENLVKRKKILEEEVYENISEKDSKQIEKQDILSSFHEIEEKRNKVVSLIGEIADKKKTSSDKINEYEKEINNLLSEINIKGSKLKFLQETEKDKEGYVKSVKSILLALDKDKQLANGVHGVLADLVLVEERFQIAIEMALGQSMQNIVTDTEKEAKKLIEYLRKNNIGRASFLPISEIRGKKLDKINTKGINGVIGLASDLVKVNSIYEKIILNLLGRTVVVDDIDNAVLLAKQNSYSFRIVTLKGDIINPSGSITGGAVINKTVNILGRKREIEELQNVVKKLNSEVELKKKEKDEYIESIENILIESDNLEKNLQEIEIVYATQKQKLDLLDVDISKKEEQLNNNKEKLNNIDQEEKDNLSEKEQLEKEVIKINEFIEKINIEINEFVEKNKDNQKYIDDLNYEITNLKISVTSFNESGLSINEIVKRVEEDISNTNKNKENKMALCDNIEKNNEELKKKIELLKNDIKSATHNLEENNEQIEIIRNNKKNEENELASMEENIINQFNVIEGLKEQISKVEIKKSKYELDLEQIINKMWDEYEVTPNNVENYEKTENVQEVQSKVSEIRAKIKELGSINIDSIEDYKQTKQRYDFIIEQKNDLEETSIKLNKVIDDMLKIMEKQFKEQFNIINKNFGEIFSELFGGGRAELKLADGNVLECGIDIEAQPPGKKLQNMMLLSGGEKALTAIALLFAILKINPAPFCVLDEIEAALDDVNVYRYAEYLKKFTKEIQFLVITHRKGTMEAANTVYGITMEEKGISKLLSIKLK